MKGLTLENIARVCRGVLRDATEEEQLLEVQDVVIDSRKIQPGTLFIALTGERVDGHDYLEGGYAAGAVCGMGEQALSFGKPYIQVENSRQALKDLAEFYLTQLDCKVVGITGSVGKTSTKEMIASVLSEKYRVLKTEGNFNNEIGLPLTVFQIREEHEVAVLEMGISDFGEMTRLSKIAKPDFAVITNIGLCHLEQLGNRDGIFKAKTEMFQNLKPGGRVILNADDDKLRAVTEVQGLPPIFFGIQNREQSSYYAAEIESKGLGGIEATLMSIDGALKLRAKIQIPGRHMVYNALAAMTVGVAMGLTKEEIVRGIEKLAPVRGRNHIISTKDYVIMDDCYNANPVSMRASIDVLSEGDSRRVAILGDMFELGAGEVTLHKEIGQYLMQKHIDMALLAGGLMKHAYDEIAAAKEAKKTSMEVYYFADTEELMANLLTRLQQGDSILVKASHGMQFQKVVELLAKF